MWPTLKKIMAHFVWIVHLKQASKLPTYLAVYLSGQKLNQSCCFFLQLQLLHLSESVKNKSLFLSCCFMTVMSETVSRSPTVPCNFSQRRSSTLSCTRQQPQTHQNCCCMSRGDVDITVCSKLWQSSSYLACFTWWPILAKYTIINEATPEPLLAGIPQQHLEFMYPPLDGSVQLQTQLH